MLRAPCLRAPPRLLRVLGLSRRLAGCLLGAGVRLDLFRGEGALRGTFAAVGALPRIARLSRAPKRARWMPTMNSRRSARSGSVRSSSRRSDADAITSKRPRTGPSRSNSRYPLPASSSQEPGDLVCHVAHQLLAVACGPLGGNRGHGESGGTRPRPLRGWRSRPSKASNSAS